MFPTSPFPTGPFANACRWFSSFTRAPQFEEAAETDVWPQGRIFDFWGDGGRFTDPEKRLIQQNISAYRAEYASVVAPNLPPIGLLEPTSDAFHSTIARAAVGTLLRRYNAFLDRNGFGSRDFGAPLRALYADPDADARRCANQTADANRKLYDVPCYSAEDVLPVLHTLRDASTASSRKCTADTARSATSSRRRRQPAP